MKLIALTRLFLLFVFRWSVWNGLQGSASLVFTTNLSIWTDCCLDLQKQSQNICASLIITLVRAFS